MAKLYSNENFPMPAVIALRQRGHDVLTTYDSGKSEIAPSDENGAKIWILAMPKSNDFSHDFQDDSLILVPFIPVNEIEQK